MKSQLKLEMKAAIKSQAIRIKEEAEQKYELKLKWIKEAYFKEL